MNLSSNLYKNRYQGFEGQKYNSSQLNLFIEHI